MRKSHKNTVCIIPPLSVQQAIQRIRCFRDKSFVRWPPHINLLYPFLEDQEGSAFEEAATTAASALSHIPPFQVQLSSLATFEHASSYTLWMDAADKSGLCAVQSALQAAFPACSDLSDDPQRGINSFTPHLSLGQWTNRQQLQAAMQEYSSAAEGLLGLQFEVKEVCICSRQGYRDPFAIRYAVPLGTATPSAPYPQPQLVDTPYIATTTPNLPQLLGLSDSPTDKLRFGLGGAAKLFNFAYGANMSSRKLGGSRGLHPQESTPGVLTGYRLAFNHRGGFGNIVPTGQPAAAAGGGEAGVETGAASSAAAPRAAAGGAGAAGGVQKREVHGLLHRLLPGEVADLMCMEHEYEPVVVMVKPYQQQQQQQQAQQTEAPAPAAAETDQQQQQLVPALAFQSPPDRVTQEGLPPTRRYLDLLREGARHWQLHPQYTSWLEQHPAVADSSDRGPEYFTSPTGQPLPAWPKIRTGGSQQRGGGGRGGGGRGGGRGGRKRRETS